MWIRFDSLLLTILRQTWHCVFSLSSYKLHGPVFHSLSSCSFPFSWCTFVTFGTTQLYFGAPLGPALGSRLVRLMVAPELSQRLFWVNPQFTKSQQGQLNFCDIFVTSISGNVLHRIDQKKKNNVISNIEMAATLVLN